MRAGIGVWARRGGAAALVGGAVLTAGSGRAFAQSGGAKGAPAGDLVPSALIAALAGLLVAAMAVGHRKGALRGLAWLGDRAETRTCWPGWASVPIGLATVSLLTAAFGFYWDVSWHIDRGRDPGPFANPAHFFIIAGLAGIGLAGVLSVVMGEQRPGGASVRIRPGWYAPVGGVLLAVCGLIALAGFPVDDIWHRLFGQDVTLWGPTHIQMVGGAGLATLAVWTLAAEADRTRSRTGWSRSLRSEWLLGVALAGSFLMGLSALQAEFDYGVPQFRQVYQPVLIMLVAGITLVAARIRIGRGGAIGSTVFFLALRGALTILIGPILGRSTLHFPLYLIEALMVELVALKVSRRHQLSLGLWSGAAIGTVGLAAEWAWSHLWMPLPWHASLWPEGVLLPFVAAVTGGLIGGLVGRALAPDGLARQPVPRAAPVAISVVALACIAIPLPMTARPYQADMTLTDVPAGGGRHVAVTVRLSPPTAADHANWFTVTAWQGAGSGDGGLVIAPLQRVSPGEFRTTTPVPVFGNWKAIVRLQKGSIVDSLPIYLPADPAIPAPAVNADAHITRAFVADKKVLQREAIGGNVGLQRLAYGVLILLGLVWIGALAWGLRRLERSTAPPCGPTAGTTTPAAQVRPSRQRQVAY